MVQYIRRVDAETTVMWAAFKSIGQARHNQGEAGVGGGSGGGKSCPPKASISWQVMFVGHCFHNNGP